MDRKTWRKDGELVPLLVAANQKIYAGNMVAINATGYAVPAATTAALTVMGVADEAVDTTDMADGVVTVCVWRTHSFCLANSTAKAVTQAMVGKKCYVQDAVTISSDSAAAPAGTVMEVSPDGVWVFIS